MAALLSPAGILWPASLTDEDEEHALETFRCPTCIAILPDAHVRRCNSCGQALRRRQPRVLGDEHRIGARILPIDRWMLDRLQGEPRRRRAATPDRVPWHGRFAPSPRSAEPDLVMPPAAVPPMGAARVAEPPTAAAPAVDAMFVDAPPVARNLPANPPDADTPAFGAAVVETTMPGVEETPAAITARDLDLFVAPTPPAPAPAVPAGQQVPEAIAPPALPVVAPPPTAPIAAAPFPTPRPIVTHEELDPEVRALVDELYEQARAELSGIDPQPSTDGVAEPAPASTETPTALDDNGTPHSSGGGWSPA